jgi:hypothetical protein
MSSRLKVVLHNIVSPHKACCILGRDIADTTASLILAKSPNRDFGEMQDNLCFFFFNMMCIRNSLIYYIIC